jgi:hypothetical protein
VEVSTNAGDSNRWGAHTHTGKVNLASTQSDLLLTRKKYLVRKEVVGDVVVQVDCCRVFANGLAGQTGLRLSGQKPDSAAGKNKTASLPPKTVPAKDVDQTVLCITSSLSCVVWPREGCGSNGK